MHDKLRYIIDSLLTVIGISSYKISTLDNIEQIGRIISILIAIISGVLLIIINVPKAISILKKNSNNENNLEK